MPGFGASEAPARLDLASMAGALQELLEKLGVAKATVVGNSLGVAVAIALAEHHPESVTRLVLVNGITLPQLPAPLKLLIRLPLVDPALTAVLWRFAFGRKAIRDSFPHASREELGRIKDVVLRSARRHFITAKVCTLNSPQARPDSRVPATLLWGADDRLTSLQVAAELGRLLPGSELVRVERAGHLPQLDQPAEFAERLCAIAGVGA
jgi:pimeloyl-ACP methyl ester carboxylesterase